MSLRYSSPLLALCVVITSLVVAAPVAAQSSDASRWVMPRTADGHPDLQGNWTNVTMTPLQRPRGQGPILEVETAAQREQAKADRITDRAKPSDPNRLAPPVGGDGSTGAAGGVGGYNTFYIDSGDNYAIYNGEIRSSLIVDPPDGRMPPRTEAAQQRQAEAGRLRRARGIGQYDNPENRPLAERCLKSFGSNAGPPMLPNGFYNNNYTVVQTADHVMIMTEMVHDTRIIQLGEPNRLPSHLSPWFGDSWGWWEGDTLVVETVGLHPLQRGGGMHRGTTDELKVTERFTRADESTINYEFTVEDPSTFTGSYSGEVPFKRLDGLVYEYACHEGNYALFNVLSGARAQERGNN
ncbi:MAG: hypothetical protein VX815_10905 [Gemmatimonadota bacterium]|nr:hypothetical protein [Gemmatimonadota bacterium]